MKVFEKLDTKVLLSTLWIFALLNYLYCDLIGMMDSTILKGFLDGDVGGIKMTESFLLGASFLMEVPIAMILLSRVLQYRFNKIINLVTGVFMTLVQIGSLFMGSESTSYYIFFSIIEITCTVFVVWTALKWQSNS